MSANKTDQAEFKALGIVSEGEFGQLLEMAVANNLYGTLELVADETTSLTFIDGYVVLESGDIPNRSLDRERMSRLLQDLLEGDGFVGRYRFGVVSGRQAVHDQPRFNPLALAGAGARAKAPERRSTAPEPVAEAPKAETSETETPETPKTETPKTETPMAERRRANDALFESLNNMPTRPAATAKPRPDTSERRRSSDENPVEDRGPRTPYERPADEPTADESADATESGGKPNRRSALRRLIRTLSS